MNKILKKKHISVCNIRGGSRIWQWGGGGKISSEASYIYTSEASIYQLGVRGGGGAGQNLNLESPESE